MPRWRRIAGMRRSHGGAHCRAGCGHGSRCAVGAVRLRACWRRVGVACRRRAGRVGGTSRGRVARCSGGLGRVGGRSRRRVAWRSSGLGRVAWCIGCHSAAGCRATSICPGAWRRFRRLVCAGEGGAALWCPLEDDVQLPRRLAVTGAQRGAHIVKARGKHPAQGNDDSADQLICMGDGGRARLGNLQLKLPRSQPQAPQVPQAPVRRPPAGSFGAHGIRLGAAAPAHPCKLPDVA